MNPLPDSSATGATHAAPDGISPEAADELDLSHLVPGSRWRGVYQVTEQQTNVTFGRVFKAQHVGTMTDVVIRSFKASDGLRERAWQGLCRAQNEILARPLEAITGGARRIEVTQAGPALTLREWAGRARASEAEIRLIVRQLSQALASLHEQGVVHLNLRSDTIHVRATDSGVSLMVSGLETATVFRGDESVELSFDPFYAPPEAVGLYHFVREPALRAWDWWALGRVIQEVVLGRHVLGHMLGRDVTMETPELRARAEALLKEHDANTRAGAVERMPPMDRALTTLLRGLLTGARDARWGQAEVEAWLRGEPVKERYEFPKNERLFFWKDRAYSVPEAAAFFARAEHWEDGMANLLEPTNTTSLIHFLASQSAHKKTKERLDILLKLGEAPALQLRPPEVVREVLIAVGLKYLAGHDAPLLLRGRKVDQNCLRELLKPEAQPNGLATVYALTARPITQQIEQFDGELGVLLGDLDRRFEAAVVMAISNQWLAPEDHLRRAALMELCLESPPAIEARRAALAQKFACSRDPGLDALFKKPNASDVERLVVALTGRDPARYLYVTHQEWSAEQFRDLTARGEQLAAAAFWLGLGHALRRGPLLFGRLQRVVPAWCAFALVIAAVGQNNVAFLVAGAALVAVVVARFAWFGLHRVELNQRIGRAPGWTLNSGWRRCRVEAATVLKADPPPEPEALLKMLNEINHEIGRLALDPAPRPVPSPTGFAGTWTAVGGSWALLVVLSAGLAFHAVQHPPKFTFANFAALARLRSPQPAAGESTEEPKNPPNPAADQAPSADAKSAQALSEDLRRSRKGTNKRAEPLVMISWPFKTPAEARPISIQGSAPARPDQLEAAQELAQFLVERYDPTTINATIAVQVAVEKGVGLMLYDGRVGRISDRKVYRVGYLPFARSWIEVEGRKAIFLSGQ